MTLFSPAAVAQNWVLWHSGLQMPLCCAWRHGMLPTGRENGALQAEDREGETPLSVAATQGLRQALVDVATGKASAEDFVGLEGGA